MAAPKPVIEFTVVHGNLEVKFRANTDTHISKVWDSYAKSRKWLPSDKARYRFFRNKDEWVRLSETVEDNHITDGSRLQVDELSEGEKCTVTFCDQKGMHQTFDACTEDDLQYWVDAFRTWVRSAQGLPSSSQRMEYYGLYDSVSHKKVDLKKGSRPVTLEQFVVDNEDEDGSCSCHATFLLFRFMVPETPNLLKVSLWIWSGQEICIEADVETPLQDVANACTVLLFGPTTSSKAFVSPERVILFKNGFELDLKAVKAGLLRNRMLGLPGHEKKAAFEEMAPGCGEGGSGPKSADVDYITDLCPGGALQIAALRGRIKGHTALNRLLPQAFSSNSATPLYLAAIRGHVEAVEALLAWGADPTIGNCGGPESAGFAAVLYGHEAVVRLLLRHSPGMLARGRELADMGKQLQQVVRDTGGSRSLSLGCFCACQSTCQRRMTLLTVPNDLEKWLTTVLATVPLIAAADRGHLRVVQALLEAGYPPEQQNGTGESALSIAALKGHAGVVKALLAAGASPHHRSLDGETPLHSAALSGNAECVRLLLDAGADPEAQSDLLLSYEEVMRISNRNFRNPVELGEWFRRQPRSARSAMMDNVAVMGGCSPLTVAVGSGRREVAVLLLDALGCSGKMPLSKAKAELLQNLLSMASSRGNSAMASLLLHRLQSCGAASSTQLTDGDDPGLGRRAAAGAGSRSRRAACAAVTSRVDGGGGSGSGLDGGSWARIPVSGTGMFDSPGEFIRIGDRQPQMSSLSSSLPPTSIRYPNSEVAGAGTGGTEDSTSADGPTEAEKEARKARARAARQAQAAEAAAQQEQRRLEQRRQHQQERRQQQLLAKKQMQKEEQQKQQRPPAEASVAENAGAELQKYILQERQQLRKKLGMDKDSDADGGAACTVGAAAQAEAAFSDATSANAVVNFQCRCCLHAGAMDPRVAAAAVPAARNAGGGAVGAVRCHVDPEHASVGPRQRRLVVLCSAGCQLDYHYPECWRELEARMKAARPDYHGLKGAGGRSHATVISCWSPNCTGVVQSACVMEGPAEHPRFRQQLYVAPNHPQQQQHQQACKKGKKQVGIGSSGASDATERGTAGAYLRKGDRQKQWQEQTWYDEFAEYGDMEDRGDEALEGDQNRSGREADQEEEKVRDIARAAEVVDLSAVKLVPLNRRQALDGLELAIETSVADDRSSPATGTAPTASLDDVEAAPLVECSGVSFATSSKVRGKRGYGLKLSLAELRIKEGAEEEERPFRNDNLAVQPVPSPPPRPPSGNAWRDVASLPFAVRPVWEGDEADNLSLDGTAHVGPSNGAGLVSHGQTHTTWPPAHQATVNVMMEEDFPSLSPANPANAEKPTDVAVRDPIIRALQLLKVPGTDILTRHLLLEGSCLHHLYTVLFRGRPSVADTQLSAVMDRYGGMTAFQSFVDGAAVAVSYRNEDTASAVAAGLGAGDAQGLLGPGSLAGAGGLTVSCLLEFPTDDALARELGQADQSAGGGFDDAIGCRAGGVSGASRPELRVDASPFVPGACIKGSTAASPPPTPQLKATVHRAGPALIVSPKSSGMGTKPEVAPAGSSRVRPAAAAATAAAAAMLQRAPATTSNVSFMTNDIKAKVTAIAAVDAMHSTHTGRGFSSITTASSDAKPQTASPNPNNRKGQVEDVWMEAAAPACADTAVPEDLWSNVNPPSAATIADVLPAALRALPPPSVPAAKACIAVVSAQTATAAMPGAAAKAAAMPSPSPTPGSAATAASAPSPVAVAQVAMAFPHAAAAQVKSPSAQSQEARSPMAVVAVPNISAPPKLTLPTGVGQAPSVARHATPACQVLSLQQQQRQLQPQSRHEVREPLQVLTIEEPPGGVITPVSTPNSATSRSPDYFTLNRPASLQAPPQPKPSWVTTTVQPAVMNAVTAAPGAPDPALTSRHSHSKSSMQGAVSAASVLHLAMPWLATWPPAQPAAMARTGCPPVIPVRPAFVAGLPAARQSSSYTAVHQTNSYTAAHQTNSYTAMQPPAVHQTVPKNFFLGVETALTGRACCAAAAASEKLEEDEEADVLSDLLGLCLGTH